MNLIKRTLLSLACMLSTSSPLCADIISETASDHGVGVLKRISNLTSQPVLIRFADSAYPPIKPNDSTDSFESTDVPLKTGTVFGSMMLMGLVGMTVMNLSPQRSLMNVRNRINQPSQAFSAQVEEAKENASSADSPSGDSEHGAAGATSSSTPSASDKPGTPRTSTITDTSAGEEKIKARAAAESKWSSFTEQHREKENAELAAKLRDPNISIDDKKKLQKDADSLKKQRDAAENEQKIIQKAQTEGGLKNTAKSEIINTKNDWMDEKSFFAQEVNQWKGMRGQNTVEDREQERAFREALERMTPDERKAATAQREKDKAEKKQTPIDKEAEKKKFWAGARAEGGFTNKDGTAMSKTQMAKKVLWDRGANKDTSKKTAKTRKEKLLGMAKFTTTGALIAAVPTTLVALSEQIGDTPSNIITKLLPWEIPDGKFRCPITQEPLLLGFGSMLVPAFAEGSILQVKRMMGQGAAWLQNPLPTPLSFTLTFKVRTFDAGGVHILLREGLDFSKVSADGDVGFATKIMLGAFNNSVAAISDRGTIVAQVKKDQNPAAAIPPGIFTPYWLSYDRGFIMLGFGQPGTNVILTWSDPDFSPTIDRIGLSCDKTQVEFSEIYFGPPVTSILEQKHYILKPEEKMLSQSTEWLSNKFREPGRGTISFQKKGSGPATISIALAASDDAPQINIPVGSACSEPITVQYKDSTTGELTQEQIGVVCDPYESNDNEFETYWVSNLYGQFTVGHSQPVTLPSGETIPAIPGTNPIACVTVSDLATAATLGLSADPDLTSNTITLKNIAIQPAAELEVHVPEGYVERRKFAGNLQVSYPFAYQFRQSGQSVEVRDQISGETWYPAATPQQMATYFFNATISSAGNITLAEQGSSKNPVKFGMSAAAVGLQQAAGLVNMTATQVGQSGTEIISQIITAGASIGIAGVAIGVNISAAALSANAKYGFRDQNSYVYKEKVVHDVNATNNLPPEVSANIASITALLAEAASYKQGIIDRFSIDKLAEANAKLKAQGALYFRALADRHIEQLKLFEQYVGCFKKSIYLITHPAIGNNPAIKKGIAEGLFYINQCIKSLYTGPTDGPQKTIMTSTVITLLLAAQRNGYLLNPKLNDDQIRSKLWEEWIQTLAGDVLTTNTSQGITVDPLFGQYLWLKDPFLLPLSSNGSVYFEAQSIGDIFACLINAPGEVRNTEKDLYEIVFGGANNTKSFLRIKSLGRSVAEISAEDNPLAAVDTLGTEKFWISIKNGTISAGKGQWGEGKLLEWTDPYPLPDVRYIGLSSWNNPVTFSNIHVGPPVEDLSPEQRDKLLAEVTTKMASAAEVAKETLMKDTFEDLGNDNDALFSDVLTQNDFEQNDPLAYDALAMPEIDQLTYDILQQNIDTAAGVTPQILQAGAAQASSKSTAAKAVDSGDDDKTAAIQKQEFAQMATGGLGGILQEWKGMFGMKDPNAASQSGESKPRKVAKKLPAANSGASKKSSTSSGN